MGGKYKKNRASIQDVKQLNNRGSRKRREKGTKIVFIEVIYEDFQNLKKETYSGLEC